MDRDGLQMGGDVADPLRRSTSVHLGGTLMGLSRESVALGGGEMRHARAGAGFVGTQRRVVHVGRIDLLARRQPDEKFTELSGPLRRCRVPILAGAGGLIVDLHGPSIESPAAGRQGPRSPESPAMGPRSRGVADHG